MVTVFYLFNRSLASFFGFKCKINVFVLCEPLDDSQKEEMKKRTNQLSCKLISSPIASINPITEFMLTLNFLGSPLGLLLLARNNHWTAVVVAFLVVLTMGAITKKRSQVQGQSKVCNQSMGLCLPVRPVLWLPATTERCLLSNVLHVNHVNNFTFIHANLLVDALAGTRAAWKVFKVSNLFVYSNLLLQISPGHWAIGQKAR